jgi:hexosaminidase
MALAEMAWSPPSVQSWPDFLARVPEAIRREEAMGLGPSRSAFEVETKAALEPGGRSLRVSLATQSGLGEIRYTLDGADPAPSSALYASPLSLPLPSRLKAQAFLQSRPLAAPIDAELSRASLLRKDNHALDLCTDKLKINLEDDAPVASDHRAVVLTDIENPCWIWRGADLSGIAGISADVANLPFNYELGADAALIPLPPPRTPDGELDVHLDTCGGPLIASLSLSPASANTGVTRLQGTLAATQGTHDLCFLFTRRRLDPIWALDAVELDPSTEHARVGAPVASAER